MSLSDKCHTLLTAPRRFLRRRGFGVHSPFAYSFIVDVLRCPYSFYARKEVKNIARQAGVSSTLLTVVFRVAARFRVSRAACFGPGKAAFDSTLHLTSAQLRCDCPEPLMVVTDGPAEGLAEAMTRCIAQQGVIVISGISRINNSMRPVWLYGLKLLDGHGMTFSNGNIGVIVAKPHLPRRDYSVWL